MPSSLHSEFAVPATSANLGPGFDAIGAALDLHLRARMAPSETGLHIQFTPGPHAPTHDGYEKEIRRAMHALTDLLPPVELVIENEIPLGRGLGSSAAAIVLGLLAADAACELDTPLDRLIALAANLEGHPDNTTPALVGGIVISAPADPHAGVIAQIEAVHTPTYLRIEPPAGIRAVVAIPDFSLATEHSRAVLPEAYAREDCTFNVQRAALLAASLASGDLTRLRVAMQDRMHQPYRARLVPGLDEALALEAPGLLGVALSGAGPTIIAFTEERAAAMIEDRLRAIFNAHTIDCETLALTFARQGPRHTTAISHV